MKAIADNSVILVQGASRGLGLAMVREFLKCDRSNVLVATSREPSSVAAFETLRCDYPDRFTTLALDVTEEESVAQAADVFGEQRRSLSMLINCAGLLHDQSLTPERRLDEVELENVQRVFAVNAFGPLLMAKYFAPYFIRGQRTVLANLSARVASISDNRLGGWYAYRGSKAAQNMFTRTMAIELQRKYPKIICVALHPGTVDTSLSAPFKARVPVAKLFSAERAARQLLNVIDNLDLPDNGGFFAWDGSRIEW